MAERLKTLGKTIEELVLICNATFAAINAKILNGNTLDKEIFRQYSVYASALNLLVGYSSSWNYTRKKLKMVSRSKSEKALKYAEEALDRLKEEFSRILAQFNIAANALEDLSKKIDFTRGPDTQESLHKVATFLEEETKKLEAETLPSRDAITKEPKEPRESKTGSGEKIHEWYETTRNIIGGAIDAIAEKGYKVVVGRGEERVKYIGGLETAQTLKHNLIKIQNLKRDLSEDLADPESYYHSTFLPTLAKILSSPKEEENALLGEILARACSSPKEQLKLLNTQSTQGYLHTSLRQYAKFLAQLQQYIQSRRGERSDSHQFETLDQPQTDGSVLARQALSETIALLDRIDEVDRLTIENILRQEFQQYESKPLPSDFLSETIANFQQLSDPEFDPLYRHRCKCEYRALVQDIQNTLETPLDQLQQVRIPHVSPCLSVKELGALPLPARMSKLVELLEYYLHLQTMVLPHHQKIERYYNTLANQFRKLSDVVSAMIAPENRRSCIRRAGLLISSLVRGKMLPTLAASGRISLPEESSTQTTELFRLYPLAESKWEETNWYSSKGLNRQVLQILINSYVN
jgi:hypothetical protein